MRTPDYDEMHKVIELLSRYADEVGFDMADYNIPLFKKLLRQSRDADSEVYGVVTEADDQFTGILVGFITAPWYSLRKMAYIGTIYVRPEYRGSSAALKLLRGFEHWVKKHHISRIRLEVGSGISHANSYRLFERLGYEEAGRAFEKEI